MDSLIARLLLKAFSVVLATVLLCASGGCAERIYRLEPITPLPPPPANIYDEVTGAVDGGEVYVIVHFNPGSVPLSDDGKLRMYVEPGTNGGLKILAANRSLREATLELTHPIVFAYNRLFPIQFRRARVDASGQITPLDLEFTSGLDQIVLGGFLPELLRRVQNAIVVETSLYKLLHGNVLCRQDTLVNDQFARSPEEPESLMLAATKRAGGPLMLMTADAATGPTTLSVQPQREKLVDIIGYCEMRVSRIGLIEGKAFQFADYGANVRSCDLSHVVIAGGSTVDIPYARVEPGAARTSATINMDVVCLNSTLRVDGHALRLSTGTRLFARGMELRSDPSGWNFSTAGGYLELLLGNTQFTMENADLAAEAGSSLVINDLKLSGTAKGGLQLSGCGLLDLALGGGYFRFNRDDYLLDAGGRLTAEADLAYKSGAWAVAGTISDLDLPIRHGNFTFNDDSKVAVGSGSHIRANNVHFNSGRTWNVTGTISLIELAAIEGQIRFLRDSYVAIAPSKLTLAGLTITEQQGKARLQGSLATEINVGGGRLDLKNGSVFSLADGTKMRATSINVDTSADNLFSGAIDEITVRTAGGELVVGKTSMLAVSGGSNVSLTGFTVPSNGTAFKGLIGLKVGCPSGTFDLGNGNILLVGEGTEVAAAALVLDNTTDKKIFGLIDRASLVSTGGRFRPNGNSALETARGSVIAEPLVIPREGDDVTGRAALDITFQGGRFDQGSFSGKLMDGQLLGSVLWPGKRQVNVAIKSAHYRIGIVASSTVDAGSIHVTLSDSSIDGSYTGPPVQRAAGAIAVSADQSVRGRFHFDIPEVNDRVEMAISILPGWSTSGKLDWAPPSDPVIELHGGNLDIRLDNLRRARVAHFDEGWWVFSVKGDVFFDPQDAIKVSANIDTIELRPKELRIAARNVRINDNLKYDIDGNWLTTVARWFINTDNMVKAKAEDAANKALRDRVISLDD
jgi:hypothetical protein